MNVEATVPQTPSCGRRWQWSLRTLLLFTAVVAAWTAWWQVARQSDRLQREISSMENVSRELTVDDAAQFAAVKQQELWHSDDRWHVYLPPGGTYRLKLATRGIDADNFPATALQQRIEPGRHEISYVLESDPGSPDSQVRILVDGLNVLKASDGADWNPRIGWSDQGPVYDRVQQLSVSAPLVIMRRRFAVAYPAGGGSSTSFTGPAMGVLLWIEADPAP